MSVPEHAAPLAVGCAFGWCLQRAGLARYERIVNVFRFRDLAVLKFLLSALLTAAIGVHLVQRFGLARPPVPTTYLAGNALGGLVFGVGMALSGFCPGTVAAGAGEGRLDYLIPGGMGLCTGALIYGLEYDTWMPAITRWGYMGSVTLPAVLRVEPWLLIALLAETVVLVFYALERSGRRPHRATLASTSLVSPSVPTDK